MTIMAIENNNNKVLNVPTLRFPEFTEEWNYESLDTIAPNITSGRSKPSLGEYNLYGSTGIIGKTATADYSGDMLLAARVGANAGSLQLVNDSCGITDNTLIIKPCKLSSHYLYFYLQHYNLNRLVFGSGQPLITAGMLKKVRIPFGNQLEQKKIENFLCCIDERITTQNKIIEKLQSLIKGIIETVISSQKSNTAITNCLECNSSTLQESQVAENGTFPVYGATGISGYTEAPDVKGESILIVKDGSGVGTVKYATGEYSYIGTLNRLTVKEGYCIKYIYFALQGFSFEQYKTGMAIPHIYFKDYGKARIYCPSYKLQSTISQQLSCIESKIDVEKRMLSDLLQQKSYLLSQMFI